jgi:hypothetical protein
MAINVRLRRLQKLFIRILPFLSLQAQNFQAVPDV